jgi:hypothetical protein
LGIPLLTDQGAEILMEMDIQMQENHFPQMLHSGLTAMLMAVETILPVITPTSSLMTHPNVVTVMEMVMVIILWEKMVIGFLMRLPNGMTSMWMDTVIILEMLHGYLTEINHGPARM